MSDKIVHLVYVTDEGYLIPTLVSLLSALDRCSHPEELEVHIVDVGIEDRVWGKWWKLIKGLREDVRLTRHQIDMTKLCGLASYRGRLSPAVRAFLPGLLKGVEWCFYVDGDTLFFQDPLGIRECVDMDFAIQAHRDRLEIAADEKRHKDWFESRGMEWNVNQYGCSGVLVMNLKWLRESDGQRRLIDFMCKYTDSLWPDQDALYYVCKGHVKFLPNQWGIMDDHLCGADVCFPACLHYVAQKPWLMREIKPGYYNEISLAWAKIAKELTALPLSKLVDDEKACSWWSNRYAWFWKVAIKIAKLNRGWSLTHRNLIRLAISWDMKRYLNGGFRSLKS